MRIDYDIYCIAILQGKGNLSNKSVIQITNVIFEIYNMFQ